jgi:hypothetical protein
MACAKLEKTTKTIVDIKGVTLELSLEEAAAIMAVVGCIGGSSENTVRKYTEGIYNTLRNIFSPTYDKGGYVLKGNIEVVKGSKLTVDRMVEEVKSQHQT